VSEHRAVGLVIRQVHVLAASSLKKIELCKATNTCMRSGGLAGAPTLDVLICCRGEASARLVVVIALLATAVVALAAAVAVLTTVSEFELGSLPWKHHKFVCLSAAIGGPGCGDGCPPVVADSRCRCFPNYSPCPAHPHISRPVVHLTLWEPLPTA
jgi:hypothetical protein